MLVKKLVMLFKKAFVIPLRPS